MAALPAFPRIVDDVTIRLVAGEVLVVVLVVIALRVPWLFAFLAVDFVLRSVTGPRWSPLAVLASRGLRPRIPAASRPTPGPPKRFAATTGAVFTLAIAVLAFTGPSVALWALVVLMVVFPALEAFFGICVGCLVFGLLIRAGVIPESVCVECADISLRRRATPSAG